MINFKILKCSDYSNKLDYKFCLPYLNCGDYYINKDIRNFIEHNPRIEIKDINIISHNNDLLVIIKYEI